MKIRVTTAFNDRQNGYVTRPVNEVFECSEQRAKELIDGDIPHIVFRKVYFGILTHFNIISSESGQILCYDDSDFSVLNQMEHTAKGGFFKIHSAVTVIRKHLCVFKAVF